LTIACKDGNAASLRRQVGDFVVRRADGLVAYQLACAVDESEQRITEVVRGADLLGSTFRQLAVMQALGLEPPEYLHLPVLMDEQGRKLSKQNHAAAVDPSCASANLAACLTLLGHPPPADTAASTPALMLQWALQEWHPQRVPRGLALCVNVTFAAQHKGYNAPQQIEGLWE